MTWLIRDILLPQAPTEFKKRTIRIQKPVAVEGDFPDPSINQPSRYELLIKGLIWPRELAQQLDEATKNPETEHLYITVPEEVDGPEWVSGLYSVTRSEVARKKPIYNGTTGEEVYDYKITFAKFQDTGTGGPGEESGPYEDENGTGFFDIEALGFDANGDGDIDLDDIFNYFNGLITWGVTG